jgi:peptidoglycan/LPS O-acetylase OafA/YrhL
VTDSQPQDAQSGLPSISYVPALDGIRGIAVLAIMAYHGGVFLSSGGFYSLDTFFTLSGFLITSLLVVEWYQHGTIRLRVFWARRARRLLPCLLVVVLVVNVYTALFVAPETYPSLRSDSLAALFYFANWHFILAGSNYFAQTGSTSPLLHTWSLAVEEQFYLVWPLVVIIILRLTRSVRALFAVSAIGALASAATMALLYSVANQNRVYYGTDTRAQSLLIGAALACAFLSAGGPDSLRALSPARDGDSTPPAVLRRSSTKRAVFVCIGVVGALGTGALWLSVKFTDAFAFRGGFFVAALATAAVLASVVRVPASFLASALSQPVLRYLGRISYGMYLWHFPLFIVVDHAHTGLTAIPLFALRTAVTVSFASLSFYAIERPIRQRRLLKTWTAWVATPLAVAGTVVAVLVTTVSPAVAGSAQFHAPTPHTTGIYGGPPVRLLVLGDSTALTLSIGLAAYDKDYDVNLDNGGILGCGVTEGSEYQLKGVDSPMDIHCNGGTQSPQWPSVWKQRITNFRPNVVMILAGRWEVVNRTYDGKWTNILHSAFANYVERQLSAAVRLAGSQGASVMLMTAPCYDTGEQPNGDPWPEDSSARVAEYNAIVERVGAESPRTTVVNFNAMACPGGQYQTYLEGVDARYDGVHFTLGGGVVFESRLFPTVVKLGRRQMEVEARDN